MKKYLLLTAFCAAMLSGCYPGPGGYIYTLDGQEAKKVSFTKVGYDTFIQHGDLDIGYYGSWSGRNPHSILLYYTNKGNTPINITVSDFKLLKGKMSLNLMRSRIAKRSPSSDASNPKGMFDIEINEWKISKNGKNNPPVYTIPAKKLRLVYVEFDSQDETKVLKEGDLVTVDIPAGDKVFHVKSELS